MTLAVLATTTAAAARNLHGAGATASCAYAVDNGCSGSQQYVSVPYWSDANYAYDSAQSGQLPVSPTADQIAVRNGFMHADSGNRPYIDYPVGSANPATLTPISSFASDGICAYQASGSEYGGGPYLLCQATSSSKAGATEAISGYDFTNGGTACVQVTIKNQTGGGASGVTYNFTNDYWKVTGTCFAGTGGAPSALIHAQAAGSGNPPVAINFYNITADGNFSGAASGTLGRVNFLKDDRSGGSTPYNWRKTVLYSLVHDFGHLAFFGATNGDATFRYSAFLDNCQSGQTLCHGELVEDTAAPNSWGATAGGLRAYEATGTLYSVSSNAANNQETAAFYISSGNNGNVNFSTVTLHNNLVVWNKTLCQNAGPYSPANPCASGQTYGHGMFSVDYTTAVTTLDVAGNMFDGTASPYAYGVEWNGYSATPPVASVSGTTLTITTPASDYSNTSSPRDQFWPSMVVKDWTGGSGFTDSMITGFGTYSNTGTINNTSGCAPGTNAGCGTITLADSEPAIAAGHVYKTYAGVTTIPAGTNYSFGGAWGATLKTFSLSGRLWASGATSSNGLVPLP